MKIETYLRANGFRARQVGGNVRAWVARICGEDVYVGSDGGTRIAPGDFKAGLVGISTE